MTVFVTILLGAIGSMLAAELLDVCPWLTQKLLRNAAKRVPAAHRDRYLAEWQAELDYMSTRTGKLFKLAWAIGVYTTSGRLAREVADVPPSEEPARAKRFKAHFPPVPVFYAGSVPLKTVLRKITDEPATPDSSAGDVSGNSGVDVHVRTSSGAFDVDCKQDATARPRNDDRDR